MANKRISELSSRTPSATDLMLVGDPTTGYSYKCLVSQVGGVTSVFGRTGAVTAQEGDYSLTSLSDVTITAPTVDQVLIYNGTAWVNAENYSNKTQHLVKLGASIGKGKAVYVSGASGTNMIVNLSSNDSEATSSKVLGLTASAGALNDMVYVITEGLLPGIDTSGSTAGDPVWLGASGNLIFGGANRPVPPLNAVYLGVVTRVSATVGEVFIRVQNGFELDELHDVKFTSLANNHALVYNSTSQLWENKALSTTNVTEGTNLYYTDARARGAISLTTSGSGAATYNSSTGVLNIPTPSSVNIYNSDGTLTASRVVNMASLSLSFASNGNATVNYRSNSSADNFTITARGGDYGSAYSYIGLNDGNVHSRNSTFEGAGIYFDTRGQSIAPAFSIATASAGGSSTRRLNVFGSGNIGINTTTDAGFRLDVSGSIRTTTELIAGTNATGGVRIGATSGSGSFLIRGYVDTTNPGIEKVAANNTAMEFYNRGQGSNAYVWRFSCTDTNARAMNVGASGSADVVQILTGLGNPNAANITGNVLALRPVINQTGSAQTTTIINAILYAPTLTDLTGVSQHNFINASSGNVLLCTSSGSVGIGTTSPTYKLHTVGTGRITGNVELSVDSGAYTIIGATGDTTYRLSVDGDLRVYGSVRTANPSGGTSTKWRLGSYAAATVQLDTGGYLEVELNGTAYKVALAMLP